MVKFQGHKSYNSENWRSFTISFTNGRSKVRIWQQEYQPFKTFIRRVRLYGSFSSPGKKTLTIKTKVEVRTPGVGDFVFTGSAKAEVTVVKVEILGKPYVLHYGNLPNTQKLTAEVTPSGVFSHPSFKWRSRHTGKGRVVLQNQVDNAEHSIEVRAARDSKPALDIEIRVTVKEGKSSCSATHKMSVLTADRIEDILNMPSFRPWTANHSGWDVSHGTKTRYQVLDQFGERLPASDSWTEKFGADTTTGNPPSVTWKPPAGGKILMGLFVSPDDIYLEVQAWPDAFVITRHQRIFVYGAPVPIARFQHIHTFDPTTTPPTDKVDVVPD